MKDPFIHDSAIIDQPAEIGAGTKIWHFCHIMEGAQIGENCNLGQNVVVASGVVLGDHVKVQNNVSLFSGVTCEDYVFIGPSVVFTNIRNPRSAVNRRDKYQQTIVQKGATIGANATIICGNTIGSFAMIGAGTVVTKNVKSYALVLGNPGKQVGWVSEFGNTLHFDMDNRAVCAESGQEYELVNDQITRIK